MKVNRNLMIGMLIIVVLVLTMACGMSDIPGIGGSDEDGEAAEAPQSNVIGEDDFSSESSGWELYEGEEGEAGYGDGYYFVNAVMETMTMWGRANQTHSNVVIDIDATQVAAPASNDNDYGVICRLQENGDGYYLLVSGDGYYSILRGSGDEFVPLVDWSDSSVIKTGNATNHITASCNGSSLSLTVNGKLLASAEDSTWTSGDIGFTATSYESTPTEIHFDNLVLSQP